jgi:hypothetical protein
LAVVEREREKERRHKERRESLWSAYWPSLGKEIGRGRKNIKNKTKKKKRRRRRRRLSERHLQPSLLNCFIIQSSREQ